MPIRMSGLVSGLDTENIIKELMAAQSQKKTKIENKITKHEWKTEKWQDLNKKLYDFYKGSLSKARLEGSFQTRKGSSADETKVKATASGGVAAYGTHKVKVEQLASAQFVTGSQLGEVKNASGKNVTVSGATKLSQLGISVKAGEESTITIASGDKKVDLNVTEETTVNDFLTACRDAGLTANYDTDQKRFFLTAEDSGSEHAFSITSKTKGGADGDALKKLGLSEVKYTKKDDGTVEYEYDKTNPDFAVKEASNSIIYLNGARLVNSSNEISVNGLNLELNAATGDEEISINVTKDTQAVYDMVKSFIKDYNELLKELSDAYYADSSYGYEPLTSEQREAMNDEDIEKWEKKIKDSLLRRDSTVNSLMSTMKMTMAGTVDYNGKKYSLSTLGIVTTDYKEKGQLHIEGDADDETTAGKEDKLMAAIEEDPDMVMKIVTDMAGKLYSTFGDKMKTTTTSSALTFYEDKQMKTDLTKYKKELSTMEDKLSAMEDRYYKQFTAMEKALSQLNSQSSSLASLFGGSSM
ncbi:MAG: flagellar filament capping protein FliD [Lachnospiraceae bacterium]|nr:flagellar filament capping protein FliD [Lachnospiraceae bacterium]